MREARRRDGVEELDDDGDVVGRKLDGCGPRERREKLGGDERDVGRGGNAR